MQGMMAQYLLSTEGEKSCQRSYSTSLAKTKPKAMPSASQGCWLPIRVLSQIQECCWHLVRIYITFINAKTAYHKATPPKLLDITDLKKNQQTSTSVNKQQQGHFLIEGQRQTWDLPALLKCNSSTKKKNPELPQVLHTYLASSSKGAKL